MYQKIIDLLADIDKEQMDPTNNKQYNRDLKETKAALQTAKEKLIRLRSYQ
jgi:hypothetical protein